MSIISSLSNRVIPVLPVTEVREQLAVPATEDPAPQSAAAAVGGSLQSMQPHLPSPLIWKTKSSDPITSLMTVNYTSSSLFNRFDGLGAAALQRLGGDPGDFSQSVSRSNADIAGAALTTYQITLNVTMADNTKVKVKLESSGDSLALQISSNGKLNVAERAALSRLADGFQKAIDGMADSSKLDFSGLLQYDHTLLSSIDLEAKFQRGGMAVQTQTFHADDTARSFHSEGQDANVNVAVDLSQLAFIGNAQQRKAGIDAYLKQFDAAGIHGHANAGTLDTFKAAFTQMIGEAPETVTISKRPVNLTATDHALLAGLPDFSASMSDTPVASNPMRQNEVDTFSYQVSQDTSFSDHGDGNRSISQKQHAHMEASFHEPLSADTRLALDNSRESQNYYFKRISEDSVSDTEIGYNNGILARASNEQRVVSSTQILKYVMGMLTEEKTIPEVSDVKRDLLRDYLLQSHT
ncbi:hypothetical protein GTP46_25705 [Duganella sp. FT135W]|uniref:Lactate dehydrogenase n=1 Tax=Duganella flavida TaxID=2692175 RepID=A0A6L8KEZ5_9BURK|nr:hypothetical protein [Duganella flavida]MYM26029.1 hypothetical protein [Duganella flavida]